MHKSTSKNFYNKSNDDKVNSLLKMVEEKDSEIRSWQNKYDKLYISNFYDLL